jgi:FlaA1/EpsC-like NDP-sugar epimerase
VQSLQLKDRKENNVKATKFITTRFGNVLGSNGSVVPLFANIAQGANHDYIRYFMTIPEACQLVSAERWEEIYIFDMGNRLKSSIWQER